MFLSYNNIGYQLIEIIDTDFSIILKNTTENYIFNAIAEYYESKNLNVAKNIARFLIYKTTDKYINNIEYWKNSYSKEPLYTKYKKEIETEIDKYLILV
jgi:hypothetical protein